MAEQRASTAEVAVRNEGNADGSPWPSGMTGLESFELRLSISILSTPLTVIAEAFVSSGDSKAD